MKKISSAACRFLLHSRQPSAAGFRLPISQEYIMIPSEDLQRRIVELEVEHRDLDAVIQLLTQEVRHDELQLRRLKKRKLQLKDHITLLKMQLVPDIPA